MYASKKQALFKRCNFYKHIRYKTQKGATFDENKKTKTWRMQSLH